MSKPYSEDLRTRVIQSYLNGLSKMDIVTLFKIGMDTLNRWIRQYLQTGDIKPKKRTQFRARKFSDSDLKDYIRNNPSVTLKQIAEHFSVKPSSVQARLKALNITYKKTISLRRKG
ncbi:MAG: transposase [Gammaproteobacteria bacterium]|nr:transposase [Gammaproteobacteria bacterium]